MKKVFDFFTLCSIFLSFFIVSCRRQNASVDNFTKLTLGSIHPDYYPTVAGCREFARLVQQRSGGQIIIDVKTSGEYGSEVSCLEQVQDGALDFTMISGAVMSTVNPSFKALLVPYEFRNSTHFWRVLNGPIGNDLLEELPKARMYGLCYYESGTRSFYTNKEIHSIDDFKGLRIRVQQSELMMQFMNELGMIPLPINYESISVSFATNEIDGAENSLPSYESGGHYKYAPYFLSTEHIRTPDILVASKISLSKLSKHDRYLIRISALDSVERERQEWEIYEKASKKILDTNGVVPLQKDLKLALEIKSKILASVPKLLSDEELEIYRRIVEE